MPLRGERTCPTFAIESPNSVLRFFTDLEVLFSRNNIVDDQDRKRHAAYYTPAEIEYTWKAIAEFSDAQKTYTEFRDAVTALYGYRALDHEWTRHDLNALIAQYNTECTQTGFESLERYQAFYRSFASMVAYLVHSTSALSRVEAARILLSAFRGEVATTMEIRLIADVTYDPDAPELDKIHRAAIYALRQHTANASKTGGSGIPRAVATVGPMVGSAAQAVSDAEVVKREEIDSYYVQMDARFAGLAQRVAMLYAQQQSNQFSAPLPPPPMQPFAQQATNPPTTAPGPFAGATAPQAQYMQQPPLGRLPPSLLPFCFYCGAPDCHSSTCPRAAEDITAGIIMRDASNRIVLRDGTEVPRNVAGRNMRARVLRHLEDQQQQNGGGVGTAPHMNPAVARGNNAPGLPPAGNGPTVGGFSYTVAMGSSTSDSPDWSADALQLHLGEVSGQRRSRMTFDGVYPPPRKAATTGRGPAPTTGTSVSSKPKTDAAPRPATPSPEAATAETGQAAAQKSNAIIGEAPVHPFAQAPPVIVDVTQKPPAIPIRNPARGILHTKSTMKLMDAKAVDRVQQRILDKEITVTSSELLSISPELAKRLHEGTTIKRVVFREPGRDETATIDKMISDLRDAPTAKVTSAMLEEVPDSDSEEGSTIATEASVYVQDQPRGEEERRVAKNRYDSVIVARPLSSLRTVWARVRGVARDIECVLDPGSQIVAISEDLCHSLHLVYNPEHTLGMESANGIVDRSLGVAADVPFEILGTGITLFLQMHVMRTSAYGILLGRPFDNLASTIVETNASGAHRLTIRCPNTQRVAVVPTYGRGENPTQLKGDEAAGF